MINIISHLFQATMSKVPDHQINQLRSKVLLVQSAPDHLVLIFLGLIDFKNIFAGYHALDFLQRLHWLNFEYLRKKNVRDPSVKLIYYM
jgi:hypothetical protein